MPKDGVKLLNHSDIITFEEILEVIKVGVSLGIEKVRITGGEPLVRKGIVDLFKMISQTDGIKDLSMTTNGHLLADLAKPLAEAGLMRVNVSLDTLDPDKYREISRGGDIRNVIKGLIAARKAGLDPIKINCVIVESSDEPDAIGVKHFADNMGYSVRFIHQMDLKKGSFSVVEGGDGGNCKQCGRFRLTAAGKIKPCLFSDLEFDIRKLGIKEAFNRALAQKPEHGFRNSQNEFYNIGG